MTYSQACELIRMLQLYRMTTSVAEKIRWADELIRDVSDRFDIDPDKV